MQKTQDVNTFQVGQTVTIPNVENYEKVKITRISDSGVTVDGVKCGKDIVISGRTPAIVFDEAKALEDKAKEEILNKQLKEQKLNSIMTTENNSNDEVANEAVSNRAKRGSIKVKMAAIKVPEGKFTVKQLAELNDIPTGYANQWVKENAKAVGAVEKVAGQRGRVAGLFEVV